MKITETYIERSVTISIDFHSFKFSRGKSAAIEVGEVREEVEKRLSDMVNAEIAQDIKDNLPRMSETVNKLKKAFEKNGH